MYYEYKDKFDFLTEEVETNRFVCFSDYLPYIHPEHIVVIEESEVGSIEELEINLYPETRIIIKQGVKTDSEMIYKIYLKKLGKLSENEFSTETVEFIAEMMLENDEIYNEDYDIEDDDDYVS